MNAVHLASFWSSRPLTKVTPLIFLALTQLLPENNPAATSFPGNLTAALASVLNELPFNSLKPSLGLAAQGRINIAPTPGNKAALAEKIFLGGKLVWTGCYG